ncbi:hypothetical protein WQ54_23370 [Bacillus sp. SA1-12]|uniref:DUF2264 domain-containing protein n=1 Tax=Bacillus sp. SA1-12 TaxID=1455638 RepID=UPI00062733BD|nr:DUF2264 domain-containing protein [Bacillus sp. SA1-12]KKI90059.1 hypothetical protein WQ54_23370 [Bacillus sp. SA1-12]
MREEFANDRSYWISTMLQLATPVLEALEKRQLKSSMPLEMKTGASREKFTHLEAFARLLVGMAPWLENDAEEEGAALSYYRSLARQAIDAGTDPQSPDYMNFTDDFQPIVDTAFLAQAILSAPNQLWEKLDTRVQKNVIAALKATRTRKPFFSNWLLFSAMIETALFKLGEKDWDPVRIDFAIKQLDQWYLGDGVYSDGPDFHYDYYNSFVIHPMLVDLIEAVGDEYSDWQKRKSIIIKRSQRYAAIQERLISPEGTFPPVGRSLAYRCGAFQCLAHHALRNDLPEGLTPAQVRSCLTAVMKRTLNSPNTFTKDGWLTVGFAGHQPRIGESYISTGSTYLCSVAFLPLGLSPSHQFWSDPETEWTQKKAWSGKEFPIDHALHD